MPWALAFSTLSFLCCIQKVQQSFAGPRSRKCETYFDRRHSRRLPRLLLHSQYTHTHSVLDERGGQRSHAANPQHSLCLSVCLSFFPFLPACLLPSFFLFPLLSFFSSFWLFTFAACVKETTGKISTYDIIKWHEDITHDENTVENDQRSYVSGMVLNGFLPIPKRDIQ